MSSELYVFVLLLMASIACAVLSLWFVEKWRPADYTPEISMEAAPTSKGVMICNGLVLLVLAVLYSYAMKAHLTWASYVVTSYLTGWYAIVVWNKLKAFGLACLPLGRRLIPLAMGCIGAVGMAVLSYGLQRLVFTRT